jgi:mono/diheme cytochrome c family protein
MRSSHRVLIGMTGFALLAAAVGCGKGSGSATTTPTGSNPPPVASSGGSGSQVFTDHCAKCHATEAGQRRGKGPNLAGVASKPDHTADWIIAHVKNPKTHKPESGMPAFEGKMSDADIKAVADYLLTLK